MNITKQNFKKIISSGLLALTIAVFTTACSDAAGSSATADTASVQTTAEQTTKQLTKANASNESFDLRSLHVCKENADDDLVGIWQITAGEGSQYKDFYYMFNGEGKSVLISANTATIPTMTTIRHSPQSLFSVLTELTPISFQMTKKLPS